MCGTGKVLSSFILVVARRSRRCIGLIRLGPKLPLWSASSPISSAVKDASVVENLQEGQTLEIMIGGESVDAATGDRDFWSDAVERGCAVSCIPDG